MSVSNHRKHVNAERVSVREFSNVRTRSEASDHCALLAEGIKSGTQVTLQIYEKYLLHKSLHVFVVSVV